MSARVIRSGFKRAFREIDLLRAKIPQQRGVWIFKLHKYSVDELLKSEHHGKIYSITEKLGDDVSNWHNAGKLNNRDLDFYHEQRDMVEDGLHAVHLEIVQRQPTLLEELVGVLNDFVKAVIIHLPRLRHFLPPIVAEVLWFLPSSNPLKRLLGGSDRQNNKDQQENKNDH
ncbi:MAG: hypothetical protein EDM05_61045 [Leptolyngbya sp. IPPAS B-1204]|nr:MAG: hypothetical protein EDM05_12600 [Leptolyngbya sp. IPPAS B-1204]